MISETLSADGESAIAGPTGANIQLADAVAITAQGTWGAGTLVLQCRPLGTSTWIPITDASWTADVTKMVDISENWDIRFSLSGSTTPSLEVTAHRQTRR
jgi:hypothetical protein